MMKKSLALIAFAGVFLTIMGIWTRAQEEEQPAKMPVVAAGQEKATFGAGCFWCVEAVFERMDGVASVTSGYMGGHVENPTYEQICGGGTGHAEVVQVVFEPAKISYATLLEWFWKLHDPTQKDGQGNDIGTQYRSVIFHHTAEQKRLAEESMAGAGRRYSKPIMTEITEAGNFYPAEEYHQGYYRQNKGKNPYCPMVITPKLKKLGLE